MNQDFLLISDLIEKEKQRQERGIELIASENYVSKDVLQVCGSVRGKF